MRQQQNNNNNKNRMRNRNNRKPSNSVNRNFESNGPDVKIRGNAAHIAEKYSTLARDALSSGDRVVAENYLQHAEHYNRIVLAANALREEAQATHNRNNPSDNDDNNDGDENENQDASSNDNGTNERPRRRDSRGENRNNQRTDSKHDANGRDANGQTVASDDGQGEQPVVVSASEEVAAKPKTRRTARKKPDVAEGISPDAAALPQGLLGGADTN
jgi:hypothetical protein